MGKAYRIRQGCWLYLNKDEVNQMKRIIDIMKNHKEMSGAKIIKLSEYNYFTTMITLWKLIAKRVVKVRQFGNYRLYSLYKVYRD